MAYDPAVFEKLGAFYLGRRKDNASEPLLYDSRDLVTHAVCVGMTGSGKTGLCTTLLEEAAIDGVPAIVIDPKGDLANLALAFPELRAEDFRPWIDEAEAARKGLSPEQHAQAQADLWRSGLAEWGQGPDRIRTFRDRAAVAVHTPGSESGIPVDILASFAAPKDADPEARAERAQTAASSLLGLVAPAADPTRSREGIFLSALLDAVWSGGRDLSLEGLIEAIQNPPFQKLGVLDLESFFPKKDRFDLVLSLNGILAAPSFSAWRKGVPLDVDRFLFGGPGGRPRIAIFSLAHLAEQERMFFVSLLLNEVLAWTRRQGGTSSLRAILYMDEIFGYLPPTANPPSKRPLLTMLKQARAFGVGVVLATQNPVDLDYKALSNAGTWFIGRLQTERDQARLLDGLQGASGGPGRAALATALAGLGKRTFLLRNVHEEVPEIFETRWAISYLRGPLTRDEIKRLPAAQSSGIPEPHAAPPVPAGTGARTSAARQPLPPGIREVFLPDSGEAEDTPYLPFLVGLAHLAYSNARLDFATEESVALLARIPAGLARPDWDSATEPDCAPEDFQTNPLPDRTFGELPAGATRPENFAAWEKAFAAWLRSSRTVPVLSCREHKLTLRPGETPEAFRARVAQAAREARDAEVDALRKKFSARRERIEERLARAQAAVQRSEESAAQKRWQSAVSIGSNILGAFLGRRGLTATKINRAASAARGIGKSLGGSASLETARATLEKARAELEALDAEFLAESEAISRGEPTIEEVALKPTRGGVTGVRLFLAWNSTAPCIPQT